MSTTIDQRVVEMQFDNRHFESNVSTTMSSLEKLKSSLNMSGAAKGFEEIDGAARKVDMNGLSSAVETVRMKFSALQVMGITALTNITNSAVNAGKRIVSALTIDPIKTGLSEYETKMNSIQTIQANTRGKNTMEEITAALDELNTYADKTKYNFTQMTSNVGKFTAQGYDVKAATEAVKGLANLAAASGASAEDMARATYQMSQALGGTIRLMDWNSLRNANMATVELKNTLTALAKVKGIDIDSMIKEHGTFEQTLSEGWLSGKMFTEAMNIYSGVYSEAELKAKGFTDEQVKNFIELSKMAESAATEVKTFSELWGVLQETAQSGWTQTWELLIGDFETSKKMLSQLQVHFSDIINGWSDARNTLLKGWSEAGGRQDLVDSFVNLYDAVTAIIKPIKEAFRDIFPPLTVEQLVSFTRGLKDLTAKLKIGDGTADKLKRTFKGLFAIFGIGKQILSAAFNTIKSLFGSTTDLGGGILELSASFGDFLVRVNETIKKSGIITKVFSVIGAAVKLALGIINTFIGLLTGKFASASEVCSAFGESFTSAFNSLGAAIKDSPIVRIFSGIWSIVKTVAMAIIAIVGSVADAVTSKLGSGDVTGVLDILNGLIAGGLGVALIKFIKYLKELKNPFGGISEIFENISGMFEELGGAIKSFTAGVKSKILMNIAIAIGILAASLLVLSLIDSDKLYDSIIAIAALFAGLMGSLSFMTKGLGKTKGLAKLAPVMIGLASAVLILAFALKTIGGLDPGRMTSGLLGVAGLLAMVVLTMKSLDGTKALKGATQMVIIAAAVKILASACADLSHLSWEELAKGLVGVSALMAGIALFLKTAKFDNKAILTSIGIVALAASIKILASACADFGYMSWGEIGKSLTAIGALLAEMVIFTNLTGNAKKVLSTGVAMIAIAAAMKIFASAAMDMASLTWGEVAKGLIGMAGALSAIVIALKFLPKNLIGSGLGLIAISTALIILAEALGRMGSMSLAGVAKGLIALGGSMAILAIGLKAMNGSLSGSAALIIASVALGLLTPVLLKLGGMSWAAIAKGLLVLAGAFAVIGVAGMLLAPLVPTIIGLAGAFALIGSAVALVGVGLVAAGAGLALISAGIVALVSGLAGSIAVISDLVGAMIMGIIKGIADGIVAFCEIITRGMPAIGEALKTIVLVLVQVLVECIPALVSGILEFISKLLSSLTRTIPSIIDSLFDLVVGILDGLAKRLPDLIGSLVGIVVSIINGVIDALGNAKIDISLEEIINIGALAGVMAAMAALAPLVPAAMAGVVGFGVLVAELAIVLAAVGALSKIPGLTWLIGEGGDLLEAIGTAIGKFVGGIAGGIAQGFTSSLPEMASDLSSFMRKLQPFIEGAKLIDESVVSGVQSLVKMVLIITAADVIQSIASWITGSSSIGTFASELPALGRGLKAFSDEVSGINTENIVAASEAAKVLAEMTATIPNEGGVVSWFVGENSISKFGDELPALGKGLKGFSDSVAGISPDNIVAAAQAAKVLAEMTATIPNEGGVVSWFVGENGVANFADDIIELGKGLKGFSDEVSGIVAANVTAGAMAAKTLAEMTSYIPNSGGIVAWFTGENSITRFADDIVKLGRGLKGFSDEVTGIVPENVMAAANAAKVLAEMTNALPNQGGVVAWFTGDESISKFAGELTTLGDGLSGFSKSVADINTDKITAGANAAKALADMTNTLPNEGGIKAWFAGETSIAKFADQLPGLGSGLAGFYSAVAEAEVNPEVITAAANAGKALAQMVAVIPPEGGIKAWFTGDTSVANFADKLPVLGEGLAGFATKFSEAEVDPAAVTAAANAAKALGEMTSVIPKNTDKIEKFGGNLEKFGGKLAAYFEATKGITSESVSATTEVIEVVERISTIESGNVKSISKAIDDIAKSLKNLSKVPKNSTSEFKKALGDLGKASADKLVKALEDIKTDTKKAGENAMNSFIEGLKSKSSAAEKACKTIVDACSSAIGDASSSFSSAGADLVDGFASGISSNSYKAAAKARAMAKAAAQAAKDELDINSPSKVFRAIGTSVPEGFASGIDKFAGLVKTSSTSMADTAVGTVSKTISMLADMVSTDIDSQPTIRPVLDLSDIKSGARSLNGLLGMGSSIGVSANIGAISSMMNHRIQNGNNDDVVSAINKLGKGLANMGGDTYNINGITNNDDSNVQEAVRTIVRAARIGGRV